MKEMVVEARSPAGEVRTATGKELKVLYNVERYGELLERYSNWERIESPLPDRRGGEGGGDSNWERIERDPGPAEPEALGFFTATGKELKEIIKQLAEQEARSLTATGKELKALKTFPLSAIAYFHSNWERIESRFGRGRCVPGGCPRTATGKELKGLGSRKVAKGIKRENSNWERIESHQLQLFSRNVSHQTATGKELKDEEPKEAGQRLPQLAQQLGKN